ncbi:amidohydrolase family protein [Parahaliea maris]|uniref:Amidohydrolase family protein n=1 Tax=Parahaliea maris TaxID=2716870 RepID=A0A5C8ZZQ6_9GAMM|nr:amidohydrolase family protein [Parahaliea maris]TXS92877.1 amidohydrolase family protein [Parahaliea maris]
MANFYRRVLVAGAAAAALATTLFGGSVTAQAAAVPESKPTLITNARIFNGTSPKLSEPMSVLVEGNKISSIESSIKAPQGATVIDAAGKTLMPGLIDMHWHMMWAKLSVAEVMTKDAFYLGIMAAQTAEEDLLRGFTTLRDIGGNTFGLNEAIDQGIIPGARIYPSGALVSQTSGHADFRPGLEPNHAPYLETSGHAIIADGVPEVYRAVRQQLRRGATQIKLTAGGGVSSDLDPLDVRQYSLEELKAAVEAADEWNTYVAVHAFSDEAVQMAIKAGVKSIEHGMLITEDTAKLMAKNDVWLSIQPILNDEDAIPFPEGSVNQQKFEQVTEGTDNAYAMAKKYGVKTAWGTDVIFDPELCLKHGKLLAKLKRWYSPFEALKMATYDNAQLLKLSGPRNPYPGELGVVKEGALADLLLVDGNPLENLDLVADPDNNFVVIMKDGKIYKNSL